MDPNSAPLPYYMPQPMPPPQSQLNYMHNSAFTVTQPVPTMIVQVVDSPPPDHMGLAIFTCLCCFMPLGLAAIFLASQSRDALDRGDVATAEDKGRAARLLSLLSIIVAVICSIALTTFIIRNAQYTSHSQDSF